MCGWRLEWVGDLPVWLSSADRSSPMMASYRENYERIAEDDRAESIQPEAYLDAQSSKLRGYLGDLTGLRICEVGVGQGRLFRQLAASKPGQLVGVDLVPSYLGEIDDALLVVANAENLPFSAQFDLIVATDVLEHVVSVGDFVLSAREALRPGGRFVVRVPLNENLLPYSRLMGCPYEFVHLRTFSSRQLRCLLRAAGFRVERVYQDGFQLSNLRGGSLLRRWRDGSAGRRGPIAGHPVSAGIAEGDGWRSRTDVRVSHLPNSLGRLLTHPVELTAVARLS